MTERHANGSAKLTFEKLLVEKIHYQFVEGTQSNVTGNYSLLLIHIFIILKHSIVKMMKKSAPILMTVPIFITDMFIGSHPVTHCHCTS